MSARLIFSKNLKKFRLEKGLSQEDLAHECGLHRTYVSSVERGERNISVDNMEKLAIALGVSLRELISSNDEKS